MKPFFGGKDVSVMWCLRGNMSQQTHGSMHGETKSFIFSSCVQHMYISIRRGALSSNGCFLMEMAWRQTLVLKNSVLHRVVVARKSFSRREEEHSTVPAVYYRQQMATYFTYTMIKQEVGSVWQCRA